MNYRHAMIVMAARKHPELVKQTQGNLWRMTRMDQRLTQRQKDALERINTQYRLVREEG